MQVHTLGLTNKKIYVLQEFTDKLIEAQEFAEDQKGCLQGK